MTFALRDKPLDALIRNNNSICPLTVMSKGRFPSRVIPAKFEAVVCLFKTETIPSCLPGSNLLSLLLALEQC